MRNVHSRFVVAITVVLVLAGPAVGQTTTRLSVGPGPAWGNDHSGALRGSGISADGRYVVFSSQATNLVPGDTNGYPDVFVHDRQTGATERISVSSLGAQGDWTSGVSFSSNPISADGRYVCFYSLADNLVPGDTNNDSDIFVRDRLSGTTEVVSLSSLGALGNDGCDRPTISADGRYVAFVSLASNLVPMDTNIDIDVFVRDRLSGTTERVSVDSSGGQSNFDCYSAAISADGRYVAFDSGANNLVPGDTNHNWDVFVHDRQSGTTERISVDSAGVQGNGMSEISSISADGRYVAFESDATNLAPGDTNGTNDVFLRDRQLGTTVRMSVDSQGAQGNGNSFQPTLSGDGRFVVLMSDAGNLVAGDTNGFCDVFLHEIPTGATTLVSLESLGPVQGNQTSANPAFSEGERYLTFASGASNFVPGDVNNRSDIFLRDFQTGSTTLVSVSSSGVQGNMPSDSARVSSDGRYVAFFSTSWTLVPGDANATGDVFVRDLVAGTTEFATLNSSGNQVATAMFSTSVSMSSDGRFVAFTASGPFVPADTNDTYDVYVRDRTAATTILASVGTSGAPGDGASSGGPCSLSADGRYVAFSSTSTNLVASDTNTFEDVFVRDLVAGTTSLASVSSGGAQANGQCLTPSISPDGRYVAFFSDATNLVPGDTNGVFDVFVRDLQTGTTTRESVDSNGVQGNGMSYSASISRDGRYVVFVSEATNLVQIDTNSVTDVFLRDRLMQRTTRVSVSTAGVQGDQFSSPNTIPVVSADGRLVAFDSYATNLVAGDTNGAFDVFLRDRGNDAVFAPLCFGDGTSAACPCSNSGAAGHGCQNSAGTGGALLTGTGSPSLSNDSVVLTSAGELPTAMSFLLQGPALIAPAFYGDGLRCTGGLLKRLFNQNALGGAVSFPGDLDPPISARSAAMGAPIPVGATRYYQVYYRDPNQGFCPPPTGGTFNISNAVAILWGS